MWTAIIAAVASIIGGVMSYGANEDAQGQAKKIADQNRKDVLAQAAVTNKQNQAGIDLAQQRFGYDVVSKNREDTLAQQKMNKDELSATAKSFTDKANQSSLYKQQLLSLWK
jgi:hypothetical protein